MGLARRLVLPQFCAYIFKSGALVGKGQREGINNFPKPLSLLIDINRQARTECVAYIHGMVGETLQFPLGSPAFELMAQSQRGLRPNLTG